MKRLFSTRNLLFLACILLIVLIVQRYLTTTAIAHAGEFKSVTDCSADPTYGIAATDFMKGVARYRRVHQAVVNANNTNVYNLTFEDARAFWYPIDTLKKFICLIERYSDSLHISDDSLGIRIYYAVYPNQASADVPADEVCHHTLFFVPTRTDPSTGLANDFDPRQNGKEYFNMINVHTAKDSPTYYAGLRLLILGKPASTTANALTATIGTGAIPLSSNQGQLCPPNCPTPAANTLGTIDAIYPNTGY